MQRVLAAVVFLAAAIGSGNVLPRSSRPAQATISDTGTRANVADITGTLTQYGGATWTYPSARGMAQGMAIVGNAFDASAMAGASLVQTNVSDGYIQVTLVTGVGDVGGVHYGPIFRSNADGSKGLELVYAANAGQTAGHVYLISWDTGVNTTIDHQFCSTLPTPGLVLRADFNGTTITVACNGTQVINTTTAIDQYFTYAGMWDPNGLDQFVNFAVSGHA